MAVALPNGSIISIASGYGSPVTLSAITNADPGVVTAAAHGFSDGDIIEVTSGWARLTEKAVRVDNGTTNTFELEGVDTTSTTIYPNGGGAGTAREVTGWPQLAQVLTTSSEGGEQQFATYQFLESDQEKRLPTSKSAGGLTIGIADDPTLPGYILASAANDDRLPRIVRIQLANGGSIYYNAYITLNKTPSLTVNEVMACQVTLSFLAEPTRYAA